MTMRYDFDLASSAAGRPGPSAVVQVAKLGKRRTCQRRVCGVLEGIR